MRAMKNNILIKNPAWAIAGVLFSALLVTAIFPPFDLGWAAWLVLVPLILALQGRTPLSGFFLGWLYGLAAAYGLCGWIFQVPGFHWYHGVPLAMYLGLYPAVWSAFLCSCRKNNCRFISFLIPALWPVLDYIKAHAGFLSCPWTTFDLSQHAFLPLLQIASITGGYGITFLIIMVNLSIAMALQRHSLRSLTLPIFLCSLTFFYGFMQTHLSPAGPSITVAAIQPAILRRERNKQKNREHCRQRLAKLTHRAAKQGAELIVWPETALKNLSNRPDILHWLQKLSTQTGSFIIAGFSEFDKFQRNNSPSAQQNLLDNYTYNSACLVSPSGKKFPLYHKRQLVPFGEYLPIKEVINWPEWFISKFNEVTAGNKAILYTILNGIRVSPVICWENLFADMIRHNVRQGASIIAHMTNDNWFGITAASSQHNLASIMRAVENRTPVILSSNTGPSLIIDYLGQVITAPSDLFSQTFVLASVHPGMAGLSWYSLHGNCFIYACAFILLVNIGKNIFKK